MKKIYKKSIIFLLALMNVAGCLATIRVQVPTSHGGNQDQVIDIGTSINSETETTSVWIGLIQTANEYLRVGLVVALMIVLIITGFKLMSGEGEGNGDALMNAGIGLFVAIFSYTIIKLLINLF